MKSKVIYLAIPLTMFMLLSLAPPTFAMSADRIAKGKLGKEYSNVISLQKENGERVLSHKEFLQDKWESLKVQQKPLKEALPSGIRKLRNRYYELVKRIFRWEEAKEYAERQKIEVNNTIYKGHLATITSQEENQWIISNFAFFDNGVWLGGIQKKGYSNPSKGWKWITGEKWAYTNWRKGEPNDWRGINERFLELYSDGTWNDEHNKCVQGFLIEYERVSKLKPTKLGVILEKVEAILEKVTGIWDKLVNTVIPLLNETEAKLDDETRFTSDEELSGHQEVVVTQIDENEREFIEQALFEGKPLVYLWIDKKEEVKSIVWNTIEKVKDLGYSTEMAEKQAKKADQFLAITNPRYWLCVDYAFSNPSF